MANSPAAGTVRTTLDMDPVLHRQLKRFALDQGDGATLSDVLRAAIRLITTDDAIATKVLLEMSRQISR